jgi:hypothetical protein
MKAIKDDTDKIPYIVQSLGSGGPLFAFGGFLQMFGLNELQARDYYYVHPVSNEFVPYGAVTDQYREWLKFLNKCYAEGLIYPEYVTATADQANAMRTQGHGFILWDYPEKIASWDNYTNQSDPDDNWTWTDQMPSVDPDKGVIFKRDPYHAADMYGIGAEIEDDALARLLEYLNWCLTEEGMLVNTFGKEGVTYEMIDGQPSILEKFATPVKAQGEKLSLYQLSDSVGGFMKTHPHSLELYKPVYKEMDERIVQNPDYVFFRVPVMPFTVDESSDLVETVTNLATTRDEYTTKFTMGNLDPNDDEEWNNYLKAMKAMGLEKLQKTVTEVYERGQEK